jgi:hypothetical protein
MRSLAGWDHFKKAAMRCVVWSKIVNGQLAIYLICEYTGLQNMIKATVAPYYFTRHDACHVMIMTQLSLASVSGDGHGSHWHRNNGDCGHSSFEWETPLHWGFSIT